MFVLTISTSHRPTRQAHDKQAQAPFAEPACHELWVNGGEIELIDTKSGKRETVPLNNDVIDLLEMIATEKDVALYGVKERQKDVHVFTGMRGTPLKSVTKPMIRTFGQAKVELRPFSEHTYPFQRIFANCIIVALNSNVEHPPQTRVFPVYRRVAQGLKSHRPILKEILCCYLGKSLIPKIACEVSYELLCPLVALLPSDGFLVLLSELPKCRVFCSCKDV